MAQAISARLQLCDDLYTRPLLYHQVYSNTILSCTSKQKEAITVSLETRPTKSLTKHAEAESHSCVKSLEPISIADDVTA